MADLPILFSAPMVRGLLDGRKLQTRRILKDQPGDLDKPFMMDDGSWHVTDSRGGHMSPLTVRFRKGDRLYVRETWSAEHLWVSTKPRDIPCGPIWYWADGNPTDGDWTKPKPGIHMPRWASRLTLTVTDVRVQRLQEISAADAIAEGVKRRTVEFNDGTSRALWFGVPHVGNDGPIRAYGDLWDAINNPRGLCADDAPNGWEANPWIVAITFTVERRNIDAARAA